MPFKDFKLNFVFHMAFSHDSKDNILRMGFSRHQAKQNGEAEKYIYSYSTFHKYAEIVHDFVDFCFKHDIKRVKELNNNIIDKYFEKLIEANTSEKTINQHRSAVNKFLRYIDEKANTNFVKHTLSQNYKYRGRAPTRATRLANPDAFVDVLKKKSELFYHMAQVQRLGALRVNEFNKIRFLDNYKFEIVRSKGGKTRIVDFSITNELKARYNALKYHYEEAKKLIGNRNWDRVSQEEFRDTLKEVCIRRGEIYSGSHMLRSTGASEIYEHLENEFPQETKYKDRYYSLSDDYLTKALGHNRRSMSRHYVNS